MMTKKKALNSARMLLRPLDKPNGSLSMYSYFMDLAKECAVTLDGPATDADSVFLHTLELAQSLRGKDQRAEVYEGFTLDQCGMPNRHFWVETDKGFEGYLRTDVPSPVSFWGVLLPGAVITFCAMTTRITARNGCLAVFANLPPEEQEIFMHRFQLSGSGPF